MKGQMTIENNWIMKWGNWNNTIFDNHRIIAMVFLLPSIILQIYFEHYCIHQKGTFSRDLGRLLGKFIGGLLVGLTVAALVKLGVFIIGAPLTAVVMIAAALMAFFKK